MNPADLPTRSAPIPLPAGNRAEFRGIYMLFFPFGGNGAASIAIICNFCAVN